MKTKTKMLDEGFYLMIPGSMGKIFYFARKSLSFDPKEEEKFFDDQSRELSNTFNPPKGLSPAEYTAMFSEHFLKSRQQSREVIEHYKNQTVLCSLVYEHKNQECMEELKRIEKDSNFVKWENEGFVNEIKRAHEQ